MTTHDSLADSLSPGLMQLRSISHDLLRPGLPPLPRIREMFAISGLGAELDGAYSVAADGSDIEMLSGGTLFAQLNPMHTYQDQVARRVEAMAGQAAPTRLDLTTPEHVVGVPLLVRAFAARQAALHGHDDHVGRFLRALPKVNDGPQWREAASTALLSNNWFYPDREPDRSAPDALAVLIAKIMRTHRQLVPLWKRTVNGRRLRMLEAPVYEGISLRELLANRSLPEDPLLDWLPGDRRLAVILSRLAPPERDVVLAFGRPGVTTWVAAAEEAGAADPVAFSKRVRRKVRRLEADERRRDRQRADGPTGLWTPRMDRGTA